MMPACKPTVNAVGIGSSGLIADDVAHANPPLKEGETLNYCPKCKRQWHPAYGGNCPLDLATLIPLSSAIDKLTHGGETEPNEQ
jgi:hypothetical protein